MYWPARIKKILKVKCVWHVVRGDGARSSSAAHQDGKDMMDTTTGGTMDNEWAKDVTSSVILEGLGEVLFTCVMVYQDDLRRMWKFLHQRYSPNFTFSKTAVKSSLAQTKYNGQVMQEYIVN